MWTLLGRHLIPTLVLNLVNLYLVSPHAISYVTMDLRGKWFPLYISCTSMAGVAVMAVSHQMEQLDKAYDALLTMWFILFTAGILIHIYDHVGNALNKISPATRKKGLIFKPFTKQVLSDGWASYWSNVGLYWWCLALAEVGATHSSPKNLTNSNLGCICSFSTN